MHLHLKPADHQPATARLIGRLRQITGTERNDAADAQLGLTLCFVAGAANAGGFLAVGQYTSHMSGIVSAIADDLALGGIAVATGSLIALLSFMAGAACCAILINWGRRHHTRNQYAYPLLAEATLLLGFGLIGAWRDQWPAVLLAAVPWLCFIMGLQNAIITKISRARMRTTHVTGMTTDIGIELGKLIYWNRSKEMPQGPVLADRAKLRLLACLLAAFFVGGVVGAIGFRHVGFVTTVPLALLLLLLTGLPMVADILSRQRRPN